MKKLALLSMLVLTLVSFTGCMAPRTTNPVTVSEEKTWPAALPSSVPKFKEEAFKTVTNIPSSTLIKYEGITKEEYAAYVTELETLGWPINIETSEVAKSFKKDNERLDVSLLEDGTMLLDYSKIVEPTN